MADTDKEAMVRWQLYARDHRTSANSIFLTYAAALIGLQATHLLSTEVKTIAHPNAFITAAIAGLVSLAIGCGVVLIRLREARQTARIPRLRRERRHEEGDRLAEIDTELKTLRETSMFWGRVTNRLLPFQIIAFAAALGMFVYWVILAFGNKFASPAG